MPTSRKEAPVTNNMPCGHPTSALNHPPGTIPEGQVRTVYCTACQADHRDAEREVIEAARRAYDSGQTGRLMDLWHALDRLNSLEGK